MRFFFVLVLRETVHEHNHNITIADTIIILQESKLIAFLRGWYRNEIPDLHNHGTHYRPLVWTADGRPHPAVTHAADIASCRNGLQMLAKSLQHRWKHEILIALRRRAAMTRAVLPNPSARAGWLLAVVIDRALHHWDHVLPLDGGIGDHDHADSETDTAIPDDDDDIASLASQPSASLQPSGVIWSLTLSSKITRCRGH